jgi:hypothetical protein
VEEGEIVVRRAKMRVRKGKEKQRGRRREDGLFLNLRVVRTGKLTTKRRVWAIARSSTQERLPIRIRSKIKARKSRSRRRSLSPRLQEMSKPKNPRNSDLLLLLQLDALDHHLRLMLKHRPRVHFFQTCHHNCLHVYLPNHGP